MEEEQYGPFHRLPESCLVHILSFTSPQDACRSAATSLAFRSCLDSDVLWERFLPADYKEVLSRAVEPPVASASKKELYWHLCQPPLIDGGEKRFSLDKATGKKQMMLSASKLEIKLGDDPRLCRWFDYSDFRFMAAAVLLDVHTFSIEVTLKASELSPDTSYAAYLIYSLDSPESGEGGFQGRDLTASVGIFTLEGRGCGMQSSVRLQPAPSQQPLRRAGDRRIRPDGWMEVRLGTFYNGTPLDHFQVQIALWDVDGINLEGLTLQGIEIRPRSVDEINY